MRQAAVWFFLRWKALQTDGGAHFRQHREVRVHARRAKSRIPQYRKQSEGFRQRSDIHLLRQTENSQNERLL